jgi:Na+/H+ antiporter NhaC
MHHFHLSKPLILLISIFFTATSVAQEGTAEVVIPHAGTWLSVVPPLLAIAIALIFRQVIPALFTGLVFGVWVIGGLEWQALFMAPLESLQIYAVKSMADPDRASIILFSMMIGGMVGITSRNGGMQGIVNLIIRWANNVKRASMATIGMGMSIFFDDYANTLVVGNTMRPVTDKMNISREKLAYLVDSTAAPIACLALVTTWVGFQVGLIDDALKVVGFTEMNSYSIFLETIPYSFYPILALVMTIMIAVSGRDFGPMLQAEQRARNGQVAPVNIEQHDEDEIEPIEDKPHRAINAIIPILTMIGVVLAGLYVTGLDPDIENQSLRSIIGNANSYTALLWGTMAGVLVAALLSLAQGILSLRQVVNAWLRGLKPMLMAMIILVLAWSLSSVSSELQTSNYISSLIEDSLAVQWLPVLTFFLAALTGFATGSSWGAMGILIPLIVPICWNMMAAQGVLDPSHYHIIYITIASILAGAVWGDHCSPISDTTILSSMASGCDHIEHVRTQMPYAIYVGAYAVIMGIIPASFGVAWWLCLLMSVVLMFAGLRWRGQKV